MYVRTSEKSFAYQIIAANDNDNTAGMNFVPNILCQMDAVIDEISDIGRIGNIDFNGGVNITTSAGSIVTVNGTLVTQAPVLITTDGGIQFDVYKLTNLTGNLEVISNTPAVVSFFGLNENAGYAGYFSGFQDPPELAIEFIGNSDNTIEGCGANSFYIFRTNNTNSIIEVTLELTGTAQNTLDYILFDTDMNPISNGDIITFQPNEFNAFLPIQIIDDNTNEAPEDLTLTLTWTFCEEVFSITETITIIDQDLVMAGIDQIVCQGDELTLAGSVEPNIDTFTWDASPLLSDINSLTPTVNTDTPGNYTFTLNGEVNYSNTTENLVQNSGFELGTINFTSDYINNQINITSAGTYAVTESASDVHPAFICVPFQGTQFLATNGAPTPNSNVWCQTVNIEPNSVYEFSAWIANISNSVNNLAQLQFSINGTTLGSPFETSPGSCDWQQFFDVWESGTNTTAEICIINLNTITSGNDFGIDNISLAQVVNTSCQVQDEIEIVINPTYEIDNSITICEGEIATIDLSLIHI